MLQLLYVDELLESAKAEFAPLYNPRRQESLKFGDTFRQLVQEAEARAKEMKRPKQVWCDTRHAATALPSRCDTRHAATALPPCSGACLSFP